jgi:hypothetical protein
VTVKASQILETVKELGEKHPNRTRNCQYFKDNGQPCCIVGAALSRNGIKAKDLRRVAGEGGYDDVNSGTSVLWLFRSKDLADQLGLVDDLSEGRSQALASVQDSQDNGATWGEAISYLK